MRNRPAATYVVLTCEHGGHEVPGEYRPLFRGAASILRSHRGWDLGALELARDMAGALGAPLFAATVSRLVVELNRSLGHPRLFSEFTRGLRPAQREALIAEHYRPHRERVERHIDAEIRQGRRVLHVGVHSFTPVLDGEVRQADVGLLYDPTRGWERSFCRAWRAALLDERGEWRVRMNYPYLGTSDGLTTNLRKRFDGRSYCGIELEVNQRLLTPRSAWKRVKDAISASLAAALRSEATGRT